MPKTVECTYRVCDCGDNHVKRLGLIDSEIYCQCATCGKMKIACDKEDECNKITCNK